MIDRLCICFAQCSTDEDYPAVRYGKQLEALRNKLAGLSDVKSTQSPNGSQTVRLPRTQNRVPEVHVSPSQASTSPSAVPPPQQFESRPSTFQPARPHAMPNEHAINTPTWQLPVLQQYTQPVTFPYPTTPMSFSAGPSTEMPAPYVAPPHQQPFMEFGVAQSSDGLNLGMNDHNNLGFTTLDDWFGFGTAGTAGGAGQDGNGVDDSMGLANVGLDLQDFWMNVGPGEVSVIVVFSTGVIGYSRLADSFFFFSLIRLKEGSHSDRHAFLSLYFLFTTNNYRAINVGICITNLSPRGIKRLSLDIRVPYICSLLIFCSSLLFLWSLAKYSGAYSDTAATLLDRLYEIGAHTHTQLQLVFLGSILYTLLR